MSIFQQDDLVVVNIHCIFTVPLRFLVDFINHFLCVLSVLLFFFFFSSRRRHTRFDCNWSSDVCSSDLKFARINSLQGQQVKVVGQVMIDNTHLNTNDDCGFVGAKASCWRSTVWEVHPVTQFYVCNLKNNQVCDKNSPDSAWTALDNVP